MNFELKLTGHDPNFKFNFLLSKNFKIFNLSVLDKISLYIECISTTFFLLHILFSSYSPIKIYRIDMDYPVKHWHLHKIKVPWLLIRQLVNELSLYMCLYALFFTSLNRSFKSSVGIFFFIWLAACWWDQSLRLCGGGEFWVQRGKLWKPRYCDQSFHNCGNFENLIHNI